MINISRALLIDGWMSGEELNWIAERAMHSHVIAEFGCYKGRSTRALADNTKGIIYAVDPWIGNAISDDGRKVLFSCDVFREFQYNLRDHLSLKVFPHREYSVNFEPVLKPDFVFIDGDHRYPAIMNDIEHSLKIAGRKAIIAGHDYGRSDWPGVKKAVDEKFGELATIMDTIWFVEKN